MESSQLISNKGNTLNGPLILKPSIFYDNRGFFYESWNQSLFDEAIGSKINFTQDNHSLSKCGVLRGLHYQIEPKPQGKLVRCTTGSIFDVAVDFRQNSRTFGKWISATLSSENLNQLWIPDGFAHGFLTLSNSALVQYKVTNYWSKECEKSLIWNDKEVDIDWPFELNEKNKIKLSKKDEEAPTFNEISKLNYF